MFVVEVLCCLCLCNAITHSLDHLIDSSKKVHLDADIRNVMPECLPGWPLCKGI